MITIGSRPQFCVLEPHGEDYTLILKDILSLRGYQEYRCNDYHLGEASLYYFKKKEKKNWHATFLKC